MYNLQHLPIHDGFSRLPQKARQEPIRYGYDTLGNPSYLIGSNQVYFELVVQLYYPHGFPSGHSNHGGYHFHTLFKVAVRGEDMIFEFSKYLK
jgi:hypothetical protein